MKKILVAVDGSEHAKKVSEEAIKLAKALGAGVGVICVAEVPVHVTMDMVQLYRDKIEQQSKEVLEQAKGFFAAAGVNAEGIMKTGYPSTVICDVAEEGNYDIIVMGSRGLGKIKEMLLGSVSNRVAHCSKKSVLIIK